MLLSEAIRLGAMLRPQGKGTESASPEADQTCAWGAAAMAAGIPIVVSAGTELGIRGRSGFSGPSRCIQIPDRWIPVVARVSFCPECHGEFTVAGAMAHLNDDHQYSRERVADWIESIERDLGMIPAEQVPCEMQITTADAETSILTQQSTPCT